MTVSDFDIYFEDIATNLKEIRHTPTVKRYAAMDIDEVLSGLRTGLDMTNWCMTLETPEGALTDNLSDNIRDNQMCAFNILKIVEDGNYAAKIQALNDSKVIGFKVLSKLRHDKRTFPKGLLKHFDIGSVKYYKVGPILDNAYGHRFEFDLNDPAPLVFIPADWEY